MKFLSNFLLLSVLLSTARATPLDDKLRILNDAMKATAPASTGANEMGMRQIASLDSEAFTRPGNEMNLEASIRQIMAGNSNPDVQKAAEAVIAELQAERKARLDEFKSKLDAVLAGAPAIIAKAQKAGDLDSLLQDLQVSVPNYGGDPDLQEVVNRANQDYQIVASWQDFLSHRTAGNYQEALTSLQQMLNNRPPPGPVLIPRSEILDQINTVQAQIKPQAPFQNQSQPDVAATLARIKTLDDLIPEAQKLAAETPYGMNTRSEPLCRLATMYAQAKSGLPFSLDFNSGNNYMTNSQPDFVRVEAMFMGYALPKFLGPDAPAQNPNEEISGYLDRVTKQAESAQNWPLLQRAITAKAQLSGVPTPVATQRFLAGLSQEQAAQYSQAVSSYETALNSPDSIVSPTMIGDRLAAIQKAHPSDYDEGLKAFLHPPAPAYPPGYGYGNFNPYPQIRPGMPGKAPAKTNTDSSSIPPKNPPASGK